MASDFPADFQWGVATAAFQIEGATREDGRGVSVWDTFCREPGRIRDGQDADVACDHYHRWPEDLDLVAGLGARAYRFSIAWPRVLPDGGGAGAVVNTKGLDFYDRLVDGLAERGIAAAATLFHWDLPQPLEDRGGWLDRDTAARFAEYAAIVAERLADRVHLWITLNEPMVVMTYGYALGMHAPGKELMLDALPVAHHQLLGHGLAVRALRDAGARQVAIANHFMPARAAAPEDASAADAFDDLLNWQFTDPILRAAYPDLGVDLPHVRDGDLAVISEPIDVLGVNYYNAMGVTRAPEGDPLPFAMAGLPGVPVTGMGWPVVPDGLRRLLVTLKARYGAALPPIQITESGCSYDESLDDPQRIDYLRAHIDAVRAAMDAGVDVRGYYVWSLMDNFEWNEGYGPRFGLVHVDYATQRRTPRASYAWYRDLIARSGP